MSSVVLHRSDSEGPLPEMVISAHEDYICALAYLPDGRRLVTGSWDGFVKVWNMENGMQEGTSMEHENRVASLDVTRDGATIHSSDEDGSVKVWDVKSHELVKEWTHQGAPMIAISPDDRLVAVGGVDVAIYTVQGRRVKHFIGVGRFVGSITFSPGGDKLACRTEDDIHVYDVDTGALILVPVHGHKDHIRCFLWSRDGTRLFTSSTDKTIRCWNANTGEQMWSTYANYIRSLSLSPDGLILASASWDKTVRLWDATSGHPIGQHLQHGARVTSVCFSPSGEFVASAGWNGIVYLWRVHCLDSVERQPFTTPRPLSSSLVPNSHPTPPKLDLDPDEKALFDTSAFMLPGFPYPTQPSQGNPDLPPLPLLGAEQLSGPAHSIAPSAIRHPSSTSPLAVELSTLRANPPDLTPCIVKADDQYVAGGGFGDIYRCWYIDGSPKEVAVKAFRFTFAIDGDASDRSAKMLRRELGIWRRLDHKNVVPFLGIAYGFGMRGAMSLVSLWMRNESLHHFLAKQGDNLDLEHRLRFLLDIASGLHYLHSFPIVHGDLN